MIVERARILQCGLILVGRWFLDPGVFKRWGILKRGVMIHEGCREVLAL